MAVRQARRVASLGETVFATFSRLAQEHGAINLGQGFPDFDPPAFVLEALAASSRHHQQYAPLPGLPDLLEEVGAAHQTGLDDPLEAGANVLITVGATEDLFAAMQAFVDPGSSRLPTVSAPSELPTGWPRSGRPTPLLPAAGKELR